jgi:hypothetical protein
MSLKAARDSLLVQLSHSTRSTGGQLEAIRGHAPLAVDVIEEADTGNARALVYGHPLTLGPA